MSKFAVEAPGWYRFALGDFKLTVVSDGPLVVGSAFNEFPRAPREEIKRLFDQAHMQIDPMLLAQNVLLIDTGAKRVLIDTGMGSGTMFGPHSGKMLNNLKASGIDPQDIDIVLLTHIHPDHAWGLVDGEDRAVFDKAEVVVSRTDYEFFIDEGKIGNPDFSHIPHIVLDGGIRSLKPYRDRVRLIEDGEDIVAGVTAIATPGHTFGHMSFLVESKGERLLNLGDVCHQNVLLGPHPEWEYHADLDPRQAVRSRLSMFERVVSERLPVLGFHAPFPGLGWIDREADGFRFTGAELMW